MKESGLKIVREISGTVFDSKHKGFKLSVLNASGERHDTKPGLLLLSAVWLLFTKESGLRKFPWLCITFKVEEQFGVRTSLFSSLWPLTLMELKEVSVMTFSLKLKPFEMESSTCNCSPFSDA
jgi:hypothetical protein